MTAQLPDISVVVCTHNRLQLLTNCLESLCQQDAEQFHYEVLVVDNASTDGTTEFLKVYCEDRIGFRWVTEPVVGLSNARNRGWQEATGRYVIYIDDDAMAESFWVSEILTFTVRHPEVVMFGGPFTLYTTDAVPDWFPLEIAAMDLGTEERPVDLTREFIVGLNMGFRKDVLAGCGGFHPELGMTGAKISYGEETQIQLLLKSNGYSVYYLPRMLVRHHLPARKMKFFWLLQSVYAIGRCSALTWSQRRSLRSIIGGLAFGLFHGVRTMFKPAKLPFRRRLYYAMTPLISECGALIEHFFDGPAGKARTVKKALDG